MAVSKGSGFKFTYFLMVVVFSLMGFYLLRVSLWNTRGKKIIEISQSKITYEAHYDWFKDGKKERTVVRSKRSVKLIGYEEENKGALIISAESAQIESV